MSEVQLPEGLDINKIYEGWWDLQDTRTGLIPGETMWAKEISPGVIGLNNNPIHEDYRWQDILVGRTVVHRRWNTRIAFGYAVPKDSKDETARRELIWEKANENGWSCDFWSPGEGHISFESADHAACSAALFAVLDAFEFDTTISDGSEG
jgi:hypothetical protein